MYKLIILSSTLLIMAIGLVGCYETAIFPASNGALIDPPASLTFGKDSTGNLAFTVEVIENEEGDVSNVKVFKSLTLDGTELGETAGDSYNTFPIEVSMTVAQMLNGFSNGGNAVSQADLTAGDAISLRYEIELATGETLKPLPTTSIQFTD